MPHEDRFLFAAADCTVDFRHYEWGQPTTVWPYHNANCDLLGFICRYDPPATSKQILPRTLWSTARAPDGEWVWRGFPEPRPLYGLDKLASYPSAKVVVCEGEKAADAAQHLLMVPDYVCITSPGGSNAARKADWSEVVGREVIIWPDNDEPGQKYAHAVAQILGVHNKMTILPLLKDKASGWDAADALSEGWHYA